MGFTDLVYIVIGFQCEEIFIFPAEMCPTDEFVTRGIARVGHGEIMQGHGTEAALIEAVQLVCQSFNEFVRFVSVVLALSLSHEVLHSPIVGYGVAFVNECHISFVFFCRLVVFDIVPFNHVHQSPFKIAFFSLSDYSIANISLLVKYFIYT